MFFPSVNLITNKFVQFWTEISTYKNSVQFENFVIFRILRFIITIITEVERVFSYEFD